MWADILWKCLEIQSFHYKELLVFNALVFFFKSFLNIEHSDFSNQVLLNWQRYPYVSLFCI